MTSLDVRERDGDRAGGPGIPLEGRARRRDDLEMLGLLLGILLVLLVLALTLGAGQAYLP
ncbi:MAG: hypothetical protein ACP5VP_05575 [Candidatus Limnocylindrales bacterium]